ncbi:MAG: NAD(P)/FAD-dependent oxidoreductase [Bacteroidales bacterium]|nr:NAD(P)/FAD-dependent oxidoreductase [Bacteroidales bacterium]
MYELNLTLTPAQAANNETIKQAAEKALKFSTGTITNIQIIRRSIDARKRQPIVNLLVRAYANEQPQTIYTTDVHYDNVTGKPEVVVVGSGPAGLFASLRLIELGFYPILLERGKQVGERKKDIALINRNVQLNTESNYCFGEGGAGTFSDGKLFTRSKKRGNTQHILEIFHRHGAQDAILYEAHPHIGTDRLPNVIREMRHTIETCGGTVAFEQCVDRIIIENHKAVGVHCRNGMSYRGKAVILATGHSARDIYQILQQQGITLEAKGFAMGVRVEHPQALINELQYHSKHPDSNLPSASYTLTAQSNNRGVYSFCMCPGGHIVPAATNTDEIVVNGMSSSLRNSPYANSGIAVELHPEDFTEFSNTGALSGLYYQQALEHQAFLEGGDVQIAPAQRLADFVFGQHSTSLPRSSYLPGLRSSDLHNWMPSLIANRLRNGFQQFNDKMRGFLTNEAIVVGVESRTSSPVRIPRESETMEHPTLSGLYPCGEGAGYAGGITSSAMDGERAAEAFALNYKATHH